jgi:hypothetical protein
VIARAGLVSNYSVGHRSRRVVVYPSAVSNLPEDLVEAIRGAREAVARWMALCEEFSAVFSCDQDRHDVERMCESAAPIVSRQGAQTRSGNQPPAANANQPANQNGPETIDFRPS